MQNGSFTIDALLPPDMAVRAEQVGIRKASIGFYTMFALSVLAGAFIAMGAIFSTTVTAPTLSTNPETGQLVITALPYGVSRLLGGLTFCMGLLLVIVGGAELFTGNNLIVMAWANHKVSTRSLMRNWVIVYIGNFAGSIGTAVIMLLSRQYLFGGGAVGLNMLNIARAKGGLGFMQAIALGILCNVLVCLAVWLVFSSRSTTDKILSIIFPITAFVAAGFEHSIANMYYFSIALLVKWFAVPEFWAAIGKTAADYSAVSLGSFLIHNLIPVTIGNIIGGVLVGAVYWFIYLRRKRSPASPIVPHDEESPGEN